MRNCLTAVGIVEHTWAAEKLAALLADLSVIGRHNVGQSNVRQNDRGTSAGVVLP
jgi:hypothetical protein